MTTHNIIWVVFIMYHKDQLVTRNSYNNDIIFKIKDIKENIVILKGYILGL